MKVVGKEACLQARLCRLGFFIKVKAREHFQTLNDREYPREKRYIYFIPRDKLSVKKPTKNTKHLGVKFSMRSHRILYDNLTIVNDIRI